MTPADPDDLSPTGPVASDRALLDAHVAGSRTAFAELVSRHTDRLWAVAVGVVRDPDDAADVVQDSLVKAFRSAGSFRGEAAVSTWLYRIVVNTALDLRRRPMHAVGLPPDHTALPDPPDPHDRVSDLQTTLDVQAALATLPVEQRTALVLVDLNGFSVDEAAQVLQCPVGTVKSRCFRGRRRLAALLAEYDPAGSGRPGERPTARNRDTPEIVPSSQGVTARDEEAPT